MPPTMGDMMKEWQRSPWGSQSSYGQRGQQQRSYQDAESSYGQPVPNAYNQYQSTRSSYGQPVPNAYNQYQNSQSSYGQPIPNAYNQYRGSQSYGQQTPNAYRTTMSALITPGSGLSSGGPNSREYFGGDDGQYGAPINRLIGPSRDYAGGDDGGRQGEVSQETPLDPNSRDMASYGPRLGLGSGGPNGSGPNPYEMPFRNWTGNGGQGEVSQEEPFYDFTRNRVYDWTGNDGQGEVSQEEPFYGYMDDAGEWQTSYEKPLEGPLPEYNSPRNPSGPFVPPLGEPVPDAEKPYDWFERQRREKLRQSQPRDPRKVYPPEDPQQNYPF